MDRSVLNSIGCQARPIPDLVRHVLQQVLPERPHFSSHALLDRVRNYLQSPPENGSQKHACGKFPTSQHAAVCPVQLAPYMAHVVSSPEVEVTVETLPTSSDKHLRFHEALLAVSKLPKSILLQAPFCFIGWFCFNLGLPCTSLAECLSRECSSVERGRVGG